MRYGVAFLAGVLVAMASSGCDNNRCSGVRRCPLGGGTVVVPSNLTAPVMSVTADAPCSIGSQPPYTRTIFVNIAGERTGTCSVQATLSDGTQLAAALSFQPLTCCGSSYATTSATFTVVSPGTGDGASAD